MSLLSIYFLKLNYFNNDLTENNLENCSSHEDTETLYVRLDFLESKMAKPGISGLRPG